MNSESGRPSGRGPGRTRRPTQRGLNSRAHVLTTATAVASCEGLEHVTIGRLANEVGMSKSGLVTLFGDKVNLQLAIIAHGRQVFVDAMTERLARQPETLPRTWQIVEAWMSYERDGVFPGGCLLTALSAEYAARTGPVRETIEQMGREWLTTLAEAARSDRAAGHLPSSADPDQIAFDIRAIFLATNWHWKLFGDDNSFERGRALAATVLGSPPKPPRTRAG
jgi:AcrR family transcriptional regulator